MTTRKCKPKQEIAIVVSRMSQHTAHLWGFKTERSFLEFVQRHNIPMAKVGKTTFIKVSDLERVLDQLAASGQPIEPESAGRQPRTADEVLARLGLRSTKTNK
jgi:hypothetical protein